MLRIACFVESNINFKISDHALLFLWKLNSILCIRSFIRGVKKYTSFQYPQTYRDMTKIWRIVTSQLMSRRKWNYEYHLRCKNMRFLQRRKMDVRKFSWLRKWFLSIFLYPNFSSLSISFNFKIKTSIFHFTFHQRKD